MIVQIVYECDRCHDMFTGMPWVLGVSRNDVHFCARACREAWSFAKTDDEEATAPDGSADR